MQLSEKISAEKKAKTILLVEDEVPHAMKEASLLRKYGFDVITAYDAEKALEEETECTPDLILMDIDLGDEIWDGTQIAETILQKREVPIVFLTAHAEKKYVDRVKRITNYGYVLKDAGELVLLESIHMAFELFESKQILLKRERNLEIEKNRFYALSQTSPVPIVVIDKEGKISFANSEAEKTLEIDAAHLNAISYNDQRFSITDFHGNLLSDAELPFAIVSRTLQPVYNVEHAIHLPSGKRRYLSINGTPLFDENGEFDGMIAACNDITEYKLAEITLQKRERDFSSLVENAPDMIVRFDSSFRHTYCNKAVEAQLGVEREQFIGKSPLDFQEFKEQSEFIHCSLKKALESGKEIDVEQEFPTPSGEKHFWTRILPEFDDTGKITSLLAITRDVTDRKQWEESLRRSEEKYRNLVNTLQEGIWIIDRNGFTTFVNPKMAEMLGYTVEEMQGEHLFAFMDEKAVESAKRHIFRRQSGIAEQHEFVFKKRNGEYLATLLETIPVTDEKGAYEGALAAVMDITERKNIQQALIKAKEKAEEADRLKSTFLASMSHEIRTPLNAIIGFIDLVLQDYPIQENSELRSYMEKAKESGNILLLLINDILDFSKIEANQLVLERCSFCLEAILSNVDDIGHMLIKDRKKNIVLRRAAPHFPDLHILGDPYRLEQILINLISNAVKFTESGFIEYGVVCKDWKTLEFYVRDTGIGISEEKKEAIFQPFRQAEDKTTRKYGGTGLGLSITKRLIELMGGEIHVQSTIGEGSTFYFTIPFVEGKPEKPEPDTPLSCNSQLTVKKILVAEDNQINQLVIRKMLEKKGYEVVLAEDGRDAISLLKSDPEIGLVFMDMYMPHLDGIETTKVIRRMEQEEDRGGIPIIALTASITQEDRELMLEAGCNDLLLKPIDQECLNAMLRRLTQ